MTTSPTGWRPRRRVEHTMAASMPEPKDDPFYKFDPAQLPGITPGTVLKSRIRTYYVGGIPTLQKATQLLYRSTDQNGQPTVNVTSIIPPLIKPKKAKVISYQSAYDSLNQSHEPSHSIAGGHGLYGLIPSVEVAVFGQFLADGYTVIVSDIEGQSADFAAGPEYGRNTLDSIRAAFSSKEVGLPRNAKVAMLGYSGGALATEWAAELAPTYAPDVDKRLVGAAMGGLLVHPAHNLHYVEDTWFWSGVMLMALVGITRAFGNQREFRKYLSAEGVKLFDSMKTKSIVEVLGQYGNPLLQTGLKWTDIAKPRYPTPETIPLYVDCVNSLIMGTGGNLDGATAPTIPLFIGQGAKGENEGTPGNKQGIGLGDGVMIAGDVRTLARTYRDRGTTVWYEQYDEHSHISSLLIWVPNAIAWIQKRFAGEPAPQSPSIKPGNKLDPIRVP